MSDGSTVQQKCLLIHFREAKRKVTDFGTRVPWTLVIALFLSHVFSGVILNYIILQWLNPHMTASLC